MSGFQLQRLGMIMEPEPGNTQEIEGVLNPAAVRGPDGELYLFPRLVARAIIHASASRGFASMTRAIHAESSGSASHWSRRPTMSGGRTGAAAAKTLASRSWNRSGRT